MKRNSITHGSDSPQLAAFYKNAERSEVQANTPQLAAGKFIFAEDFVDCFRGCTLCYGLDQYGIYGGSKRVRYISRMEPDTCEQRTPDSKGL